MKRFFYPEVHSSRASLGLLLLRLLAGVAMMHHGWGKIQNPFGWMGPTAPVPGFLQGLAALSEFGGGLALVLGLLTPLAMLGLACTMAFASFFHISKGDPFVAKGGGASWELASLYLVIAICFILVGPGRFSLDAKLFRRAPARA